MRAAGVLTILSVVASVHGIVPAGYVVNKADGKAYKLVYQAKPWERAVKVCEGDGAKLAVPKTQEEFLFIQQLVRGMYYPSVPGSRYKLLAWLGIHNHEDHTVWRSIDGENIEDTGFHKWATENNGVSFSDDPAEPHCAGIDAVNPGLRDYWCHHYQPFVCQK